MKVLMICLGNICRSPMAQGILEHKLNNYHLDWIVDSAGTSGWHDGEKPDSRAIQCCLHHGINISNQVSRKLKSEDFDSYDLLLVMDSSNYQDVRKMCKDKSHEKKIQLILNYSHPKTNMAVPDPYYDGNFEQVYFLLDKATDALINQYHNQVV